MHVCGNFCCRVELEVGNVRGEPCIFLSRLLAKHKNSKYIVQNKSKKWDYYHTDYIYCSEGRKLSQAMSSENAE